MNPTLAFPILTPHKQHMRCERLEGSGHTPRDKGHHLSVARRCWDAVCGKERTEVSAQQSQPSSVLGSCLTPNRQAPGQAHGCSLPRRKRRKKKGNKRRRRKKKALEENKHSLTSFVLSERTSGWSRCFMLAPRTGSVHLWVFSLLLLTAKKPHRWRPCAGRAAATKENRTARGARRTRPSYSSPPFKGENKPGLPTPGSEGRAVPRLRHPPRKSWVSEHKASV